jgi:TDG/mug DNA glycosylase family protein
MANHRVVEQWMGLPEETLEDLLRPGLRAVCVGINPSRVSVEAGHYQGRLGRLFLRRLRGVGLLTRDAPGYEDDVLFAEGVGFTDVIKRATTRARELRPDEFARGRGQLLRKLNEADAPLVIFTYGKTAEVLFGGFRGVGLLPGQDVVSGDAFVMPGPYGPRGHARRAPGPPRLMGVRISPCDSRSSRLPDQITRSHHPRRTGCTEAA